MENIFSNADDSDIGKWGRRRLWSEPDSGIFQVCIQDIFHRRNFLQNTNWVVCVRWINDVEP